MITAQEHATLTVDRVQACIGFTQMSTSARSQLVIEFRETLLRALKEYQETEMPVNSSIVHLSKQVFDKCGITDPPQTWLVGAGEALMEYFTSRTHESNRVTEVNKTLCTRLEKYSINHHATELIREEQEKKIKDLEEGLRQAHQINTENVRLYKAAQEDLELISIEAKAHRERIVILERAYYNSQGELIRLTEENKALDSTAKNAVRVWGEREAVIDGYKKSLKEAKEVDEERLRTINQRDNQIARLKDERTELERALKVSGEEASKQYNHYVAQIGLKDAEVARLNKLLLHTIAISDEVCGTKSREINELRNNLATAEHKVASVEVYRTYLARAMIYMSPNDLSTGIEHLRNDHHWIGYATLVTNAREHLKMRGL